MQHEVRFYLFLLLGLIAVFAAIMMITRRNPVVSVLFLIVNFFCISGLYLLLKAQFIAVIQIIVYTGAIMVLFLFVIMLLNLQEETKLSERFTYKKVTSLLLSILLGGLLFVTFYYGIDKKDIKLSSNALVIGQAETLGKALFTAYSFHVLIAGMLLLVAVIGTVVLAKKKFE
ncbi:MAG: NADH-quinone oxidoreductase subunit J [Ignavibacteria bacterium]